MGSLLNLGFVFYICFCTALFADRTQENIKSVVIAVLLSPKLQAYKGDTPKDGVLVRELPLSQKSYTLLYLLNRPFFFEKKHHFPKNYLDDASVQNTIEAAIGEELIQSRSKLKKAVSSTCPKAIQDMKHDTYFTDPR